ncbi:hypothetical protein IOCL2690_000089900 [Leishmania lindenbergi]|uniref:Secreted protein n=1 Tax=Leishmania lindenbergi TaxID=651832 RepID=A0AAW3AY84_9TRYP
MVRQRLRRYVLRSSKTSLLVHAGTLSDFAYVVTHPSRCVQCCMTVVVAPPPPRWPSRKGSSNDVCVSVAQHAEAKPEVVRIVFTFVCNS